MHTYNVYPITRYLTVTILSWLSKEKTQRRFYPDDHVYDCRGYFMANNRISQQIKCL